MFVNHENGNKDDEITIHHSNKYLCPVKAWAEIVIRILNYQGATVKLTVNTVLIGKRLMQIESSEILNLIRNKVELIGKQKLGLSKQELGTHSI